MNWKAFAGRLALEYHWPPDAILDLTVSEMLFWLEAAGEARK